MTPQQLSALIERQLPADPLAAAAILEDTADLLRLRAALLREAHAA